MATQHNFRIKNGLEVAGVQRISSAGVITGTLDSNTTATTQSSSDNSTKLATTAFVGTAITNVIGGAPGTLDTLNELAAAINDDASYASTLTTALAGKLSLTGGTMTGNLTAGDGTNISMDLNSSGQLKVDGSGYVGAIALDATAMRIYHNSSIRDLVLGTNETARLTIDGSTGGIGIPGRLAVLSSTAHGTYDFYNNGTSYFNGAVTIDADLDISSTGWATAVLDGATGGDIILQDNNVNIGEIYAGAGHGLVVKAHSGHGITFLTGGGATEKARILTTGEMGIGSGGPTADYGLSISKGGALGLRIKSDGQQGYTQGAISLESSVNTDNPAGRGQGVYMFNEANDITWYTGTLYNNASTYGISYKSGSSLQHAAADNTNAGLFMVIKNNGTVGIGTNNPTIGKLHVAGKIYSTTEIQGDNAVAKTSNSLATFGSNSASVGVALSRDADAATYPDLVIGTTGVVNVGEQGNVIGSKWLSSHENLYWNSKFIYSGGGYGSAPDKWITQGGNVTITSEHPFNKGFSTSYTNVQSASHTTNINNATQSTPHWKGIYTTFSGATNFGGNQNSSIGGGWENGEGALMKCVYNGNGASNSTNAVRGYIWKNFFSAAKVQTRQSFFYFLESGEFSSGYFAGYAGQYGNGQDYVHGSANTDSSTGQHRHTTTGQWVYVNHQCGSYLGATYNNASQGYMHGFGFRPGYATTVWIAVPGLTSQVRDDGKTINIHSAQQQIGQG